MPRRESSRDLLSPSQLAALRYVEQLAEVNDGSALERIERVLTRTAVARSDYDRAMACVTAHARVALHFHPDRIGRHGTDSVAERLLADGIYRNQFETGLSSGSVSAFAGGARDRWEKALFGDAYHAGEVSASERPKYGALELVRFPDGPIPRFGSCYFVLKPLVSERTSFTFMGSEDARAAERIGTIDRMRSVMAWLLEEIEQGGMTTPPWPPYRAPTLGVPDLTIARLLELLNELAEERRVRVSPGRVLDTEIEAQVHGSVNLARDVESLAADASFADTATGRLLQELADRYGFALRWHGGFRLLVRDVPDDFRGPAMPAFARRVAGDDDVVDASVIGRAQVSLRQQPRDWNEWGSEADVLQLLKQLWHVVVHCGSPARAA